MNQEGYVENCIFCRIASGQTDTGFVHQDAQVVAIDDRNPQAPTHVLVIPRQHFANARDVADREILARIFEVAHQVADQKGVAQSGYRLVFNVGPDAGQSVDHVHLHVLGGRRLDWPPG